jgi:alkylated DNA repair protein alkB family protein 6
MDRLQLLGGTISHAKQTLLSEPIPGYLTNYPNVISRLRSLGIFKDSKHGEPNHIILNEYLPGQGIMPHEDGPSYHPVVATISLGSHAVFHYYRYSSSGAQDPNSPLGQGHGQTHDDGQRHGRTISPHPILSILLERRSLVITRRELYTGCLHGIDELTEDRFDLEPSSEIEGLQTQDLASPLRPRIFVSRALPTSDDSSSTKLPLSNTHLLSFPTLQQLTKDKKLLRETRWSLTCRDVEKVVKVGVGLRGGTR